MTKKKEYVGKKKKHDKSHLTWDDEHNGWEGVVYTYTLDCPDDPKHGWKYVGCTPEESTRRYRWGLEKNKYAGRKIAEARQQYGIKNFSYVVLETHYDSDIDALEAKLEEREEHYIKQFDSIVHGFNSNYGGTGRKGVVQTKDEIDRRNASRKKNGFHHTEETKQHLSEINTGRKHTDDTKAKISIGNKGKRRTEVQRQTQSQRMKGKVPTSATEGAKKWVEQNGGSYWKGKQMPDSAKAKMKLVQQANGTAVRVIKVDDNSYEDFSTMLDASKKTGDGTGSIKYSIEHGSKTKRGYRYEKIAKP